MGVFIGNFLIENDERYLVGYINREFNNLSQDILSKGLIVEDLPEIEYMKGKIAVGPYYNPKTNELWYEYQDSVEPVDEITELKNQIADLWEMVLFGGAE